MRNLFPVVLLLVCGAAIAEMPANFSESKHLLTSQVFKNDRIDRYCGCAYDARLNVDPSCGLKMSPEGKYGRRQRRIEWEHVIPASDFGRQRLCWRNHPEGVSGRKNCEATDDVFNAMEADPHNLFPVVGALNAVRSNYRYGEIAGEPREFGSCDFEISGQGKGHFIEPPNDLKGDVARIYFYFEDRYGHKIGDSQRRVFNAWSRQDPVDERELTVDRRIEAATGVSNPYVRGRAPRER